MKRDKGLDVAQLIIILSLIAVSILLSTARVNACVAILDASVWQCVLLLN